MLGRVCLAVSCLGCDDDPVVLGIGLGKEPRGLEEFTRDLNRAWDSTSPPPPYEPHSSPVSGRENPTCLRIKGLEPNLPLGLRSSG